MFSSSLPHSLSFSLCLVQHCISAGINQICSEYNIMELQFLFWDVVSVYEETLDGSMKVSLALVISKCL